MTKAGQRRTFAKTPRRRSPEADWQREVVAFMRTAMPGAVVAHAANERTASKEEGLFPGYPDLMIHYQGVTVGIELKAGKNRLRTDQERAHAALLREGVQVLTLPAGDRDGMRSLADEIQRVAAQHDYLMARALGHAVGKPPVPERTPPRSALAIPARKNRS